jgi:hypothetical protein
MENYALFVAPHFDEKEHGFWALANTCTSTMPNNFDGCKEKLSTT